ncbi:replication endonuclease [Halomonas sp.]|uniref:replication endonuclease n=1 Tax=Halomonas sp. TaxID=1486246 RepID=UPI00298D9038|nr:replication endonuclease [Halomonas sp.]MDW7746730.1 replication endonuclease [Halomonas sp.]
MSTHRAAIDRETLATALLRCGPWFCTDDDDALVAHAQAQARATAGEAAALGDVRLAYQRAARRVERHHLKPPERYGERGGLARMSCDLWWRRQLRRLNARRLEQRERVLGRVHDRAGIYVSERGYRARRAQRNRNTRAMEAVAAINQFGQEYTLAELAELGLANPDHRRAELMLRINDTEEEANRLGHVGMFYTLTCPSRFHAVWKGTARHNPKWAAGGAPTPREAQAYLRGVWAKIRAKLKRDGIGIYGLRTVEPHHDGCPHWHMMMFMAAEDEPAVTEVMRRYALEDSPEEVAGDEQRRFKPVPIDPAKGTAAGYIAKYIAKNINGAQFTRDAVDGDHLDHYGHDLTSSAPRIESWSSCWGIRQFQFVGLPSVTVWREVRRLKDEQALADWEAATRPDPEAAAILADVRRAALANRWDKYVALMGGPMAGRQAQPVRPWRVVRQDAAGTLANPETGEATFDALGRYGEPLAATFGLSVISSTGEADYLTRLYRWEIVRKAASAEGLEGLTFAGTAGAWTWTCVTNCTGAAELPPASYPLAPWERRITESFRAMFPPLFQSEIDRYREWNAIELAKHRAESDRRRAIADHESEQRAADRERLRQGQAVIAGWLLDGTMTLDELTPEAIDVLTA